MLTPGRDFCGNCDDKGIRILSSLDEGRCDEIKSYCHFCECTMHALIDKVDHEYVCHVLPAWDWLSDYLIASE